MEDLIGKLLYICPMLLLAGIIDGAVGGGGVVALPAYIMTGMPVRFAYGCNKLQSCLGTCTSAWRYMSKGFIDIKVSLLTAVSAIIGSYTSTKIVFMLREETVAKIVLICLPVVVVMMFLKKSVTTKARMKLELTARNVAISLFTGLLIGFYDGIFGPGCGTISMILFALFLNYDMRAGCGNGKIVIIISNFIALTRYIAEGAILFEIAIPATICNIIGSYIGAEIAVRKGNKIVMPFMILVVVILVVQTVLKLVMGM